jgi:hypothetical protein
MGTRSKGRFKIVTTTQLTKKDKEGKQEKKRVVVGVRCTH